MQVRKVVDGFWLVWECKEIYDIILILSHDITQAVRMALNFDMNKQGMKPDLSISEAQSDVYVCV